MSMKEVWYLCLKKPVSEYQLKMISKMTKCVLIQVDSIPEDNKNIRNIFTKNGGTLGQIAFLGWVQKEEQHATKG